MSTLNEQHWHHLAHGPAARPIIYRRGTVEAEQIAAVAFHGDRVCLSVVGMAAEVLGWDWQFETERPRLRHIAKLGEQLRILGFRRDPNGSR